jgi:hypothetical protein
MGAPQQEPHHEYFTEDVAGDTFQFDTAVYTVTSGTVRTVVHEGASASGNENFTVTVTPQNVVAVDAGNQYSIAATASTTPPGASSSPPPRSCRS